jgi:expansin (peptidoglycan-binding protein)
VRADAEQAVGECAPAEERHGEATYYDFADGSGNCSFDPTPDDLMVGAMNHTDYAESAACGSCAEIDGPRGRVEVRIVDRCPECAPGDIDLSPEAFAQIANIIDGRVPITWRQVPCPVTGPIVYKFKDGSNPWWTAVQVRNHRHPIAGLEYATSGDNWVPVERLMYNYFVQPSGMGQGPLSFRVTDIHGHELIDTGVPQLTDAEHSGAAQLPPCPAP